MYLEHFKLNELPFSITPSPHFYCDIPSHQNALNTLLFRLKQGDELITITGSAGTGKSLLCQLLINQLDDNVIPLQMDNTTKNGQDLLESLAQQLNIEMTSNQEQGILLDKINQRLLELQTTGKQSVLIIDESHSVSNDCLKTIEQLKRLDVDKKKYLQIVMFGQRKLNRTLKQRSLRQLRQCIAFSYGLKSLNKKELSLYLNHRLAKAGFADEKLFSTTAQRRLFRACAGSPRLLNILCHKALLVSYGRGLTQVDKCSVRRAIADTESVLLTKYFNGANIILALTTLLCTAIILIVYRKAGLF